MIITTSICANYLPKAMSLAMSLKQHMPEYKFVLCLLEPCIPDGVEGYQYFDEIILAKELWNNENEFHRFIFKYTLVEASTSVKGAIFTHLLTRDKMNNEPVIYLDPDIKIYSRFEELEDLLKQQSIVVAPHLLKPGNIQMELSSLKHGVFNLGFLAVAPTDSGIMFLKWWSDRLSEFCYDDICSGLFTDQKWINIAPCFFDVFILKHSGYDYATWSLKTSNINKINDDYYVDNDKLRFIHYSGIDGGTIDWAIKEWSTGRENHEFSLLYEEYQNDIESNDVINLSKIEWGYSKYKNGKIINEKARRNYRNLFQHFQGNPFLMSNLYFRPSIVYILIYLKNKLFQFIKRVETIFYRVNK